ncbi:MAG TPA: hopanoid biosynthesis associated radical SAM protein HpnJ [Syntrophobacteraceae bacterium]|nr:hopanoid biosynthesis associated radical SAM protein HpnJ [Syntrophobacteraceae bacterium]
MKKALFLSPPSFKGFDGAAGARYPARREITSYWYPTWLAQPVAMIPGSRLIDAPSHGLSFESVLQSAKEFELVVISTSSPTLRSDILFVDALKARNPSVEVGFVGAHVTVLPEETLKQAPNLDFVCRREYDYTCLELAQGAPYERVKGLSYRAGDGSVRHNPDRDFVENLDELPSVLPVYHRDLVIENYFVGYLLHPFISFYTGRGCSARCTFCLWPQTLGGRRYRTRRPEAVVREVEEGKALFPGAREWFFDDDTFTADPARAVEISKGMKRLGLTWSCNARANLDYETLRSLRNNGLRLLVVGFESGNQQILNRIRKGVTLDTSRRFMQHCRELGIKVHGTFIIGLPIETRETIEKTIRFAQELDPYTIQVSIAAPFEGTDLHAEAVKNGWIDNGTLVAENGIQMSTLHYPDLDVDEIEEAVERMYRRFYFRWKPILRMFREMATERHMLVRRLREGREFLDYLHTRKRIGGHLSAAPGTCADDPRR